MTTAAAPAAGRRVAVFDLDGTLLRGDTTVEFIRGLILRSRARTAAALLTAPLLGPLFFMPFVRRYAITVLLWIATAGLPPGRVEALVDQFAAEHAAEGNQIRGVLDRLHAHLAAGDRVVIATGCADWLATATCRALGLDTVEVVAARLRQGRIFVRPSRECGMWNALPTSTGVMSFGLENCAGWPPPGSPSRWLTPTPTAPPTCRCCSQRRSGTWSSHPGGTCGASAARRGRRWSCCGSGEPRPAAAGAWG